MHDKRFTPEEMEILQKNPYVVSVTPIQITYSLAFRKFVMEQYNQGLRSTEIFRRAGFDPEMLGKIFENLLEGIELDTQSHAKHHKGEDDIDNHHTPLTEVDCKSA